MKEIPDFKLILTDFEVFSNPKYFIRFTFEKHVTWQPPQMKYSSEIKTHD